MSGNRITAESVQDEQVKSVLRHSLENKARYRRAAVVNPAIDLDRYLDADTIAATPARA